MRCEFIKAHRGEFGPIRKACEILRVSRSEYYDYLNRPKPNARIEREALEGFVVEKFEPRKGRYGYRRINRELRRDGIAQSMSRPGNPWDNAVAESFFKTLKRELINDRRYKTRDEARQEVFKYVELHYNRQRLHSKNGYMAPCDLERDAA